MIPQHILVPLDFHAPDDPVLAQALDLAQAVRARLTLLHVIEPWTLGVMGEPTGLEATVATCTSRWEAEARLAMQQMIQSGRDAGVACHGMVLSGVPTQMILEVARVRQIDLIIMGTHGRTGLSHALLGSVAERVARYALCPVMVVRCQESCRGVQYKRPLMAVQDFARG